MNDIVAEFASSLDEQGNLKQYHIVAGSVFFDEYNETLDSATLVLDHVKKQNRLIDIEPYEYVHVFDKNDSTNFDRLYLVDNFSEQEKNINKNLFSYTINLMSETKLLEKIQCPNVTITHRVQQGTTLYLSIYEHMKRYIELYVPYAKMRKADGTGWEYRQIITIPGEGTDFYNKFNVQCADMSFNMPTLRQLLTTLMQQVGCIPVVRKGELGYLDLRAEPVSFGRETNDDFTVSRIQRSLSSDSYANTLVNISDNVLDSGNKVVSERLGFRDKNNAILKQTENLYLETKFPIYKVNSFKINMYGTFTDIGNILTTDIYANADHDEKYGELAPQSVAINGSTFEVNFNWTRNSFALNNHWAYIGFELTVCFYKDNALVAERKELNAHCQGRYSDGQTLNLTYEFLNADIPDVNLFNQIGVLIKVFVVRQVDENDQVVSGGTTISEECQTLIYYGPGSNDDYSNLVIIPCPINDTPFLISRDITPLIKEASIRQNLENNFLNMNYENIHTIEELGQYLYGTVGYSIGSRRIFGFSDVYSQTYAAVFGPYNKTKTYIENIFEFISHKISSVEIAAEIMSHTTMLVVPKMLESAKISPLNSIGYISFVPFTFDIEYQPLNSFNLSFSKQNRDIPYAIQQLDTNASGLTDFDRLVLREQETVDRIGNVVISISQRAMDLSQIRGNPTGTFSLTYFLDDLTRDGDYDDENESRKYILFKRQIAVNDYYYDVSYTGMENAILKDYFTSIRTKYRAYEYVDYNQSVLRKERDTIYIRLGTNSINGGGSDNIHFPWSNNEDQFIDGFKLYDHHVDEYIQDKLYSKNIKYICETGWSNHPLYKDLNWPVVIKNDVSIISTNNMLAFIYENDDNAGSGTYIASSKYNTYYENDATEEEKKLAGVPQSWQIWKDLSTQYPYLIEYAKFHHVIFTGSLNIAPELQTVTDFTTEITEAILNRQAILPYVDITYGDYNAWDETSQASKKFSIGRYNVNSTTTDVEILSLANNDPYARLFYKDYSERINHTVQFVYYTDEPDRIAWTELFIANSSLAQKVTAEQLNNTPIAGYSMALVYKTNADAPLENNDSWHTETPGGLGSGHFLFSSQELDWRDYVNIVNEGSRYAIEIDWHNAYQVFTVAFVTNLGTPNELYKDIISFKRKNNEAKTRFYLTFNDTKSNFVLDRENSGLLRKVAKVEYNGASERGIVDLDEY